MVDYPAHRIVGPRLVLRPPVIDDAGAIFQRIARDPQVTKYLQWEPHADVAATRRVITEKTNVNDDERTWAVELRHSGELIGLTSCRRPGGGDSVELGSCLGRRWWGKRYTTEMLAILTGALEADPTVHRVWATCHVDNRYTARLLEQGGFVLEKRLPRYAVYPSIGPEPQDCLLYAKALR